MPSSGSGLEARASASTSAGTCFSRNRRASRVDGCTPMVATTMMPAITSQPAAPQFIARNVYTAGAHTLPSVPLSSAAPW